MSETKFVIAHGSDTDKTATPVSESSANFQWGNTFTRVLSSVQPVFEYFSPYLDYFGVPRQIFTDARMEHFYMRLQENFADYNFVKFIADVVNAAIIVALIPLLLAVNRLRDIRDKVVNVLVKCRDICQYTLETICTVFTFIYEEYQWILSIAKGGFEWAIATYDDLVNGDMTWKQLWNELLSRIENQLRDGVAYFGPQSAFTRIIRLCKIGDILEKLRLENIKQM